MTLIELLVVLTLLGAVLALTLPAVQAARESAHRAQCRHHFRQIGLGLIHYESTHRVFPPAFTRDPDHNLLSFVLPFVEQNGVHARYHFARHWNSAENKSARESDISLFVCPTAPTGRRYVADYAACTQITSTVWRPHVVAGRWSPRCEWTGLFPPKAWHTPPAAAVRDGLSNTFLLFEAGGRPFSYRQGRLEPGKTITGAAWADDGASFWIHDVCNGLQLFNCSNNNEIYGFHSGGCNFLYADGAVRFHPTSLDGETFVSLFTPAAADLPGSPP